MTEKITNDFIYFEESEIVINLSYVLFFTFDKKGLIFVMMDNKNITIANDVDIYNFRKNIMQV